MPLIFQYGSNCLTARLNGPQRLNGAAVVVGRAQTVDQYDIAFDVWSQSNGCAASNLVPAPGTNHHAWGVLYKIPEERIWTAKARGQKTLEAIEGANYAGTTIRVRSETLGEVDAITFLVKKPNPDGLWTSADYVGHIVHGLRSHSVPEDYIQRVIDAAIQTNTRANDQPSAQRELHLIERLRTPT